VRAVTKKNTQRRNLKIQTCTYGRTVVTRRGDLWGEASVGICRKSDIHAPTELEPSEWVKEVDFDRNFDASVKDDFGAKGDLSGDVQDEKKKFALAKMDTVGGGRESAMKRNTT
jgi:hypothetical protein